jgi:hypothetical protein
MTYDFERERAIEENLEAQSIETNLCPVCGLSLCPHGVCPNNELVFACQVCLDPYSIVMSAMKYVSVVSGPAMDGKGYRAFMDSMRIFSEAAKAIYEDRR